MFLVVLDALKHIRINST